ncbi:ABATE domain-containing protein [Jiangella mangrovi]|uniref:Putative RNA-binding Zn ribbon-like protein n=1 Tax=Jiangella mangrovi TaxID=1524084 RepID=A0A7W9GUQ3_9ACTN|nr:putative RNA-binding Zn ribbon-like protein [Jiangella mangrovi]
MAEAVALDPGAYGGTYKLIGGAAALDFANLVSYRDTDREHDWLAPPSNLGLWVAAAGLDVGGPGSSGEVREARELRELLARVFLAVADGVAPAAADLARIGSLADGRSGGRRLEWDADAAVARWVAPPPSLPVALGSDAAALLTSAELLRRVTACDECRWVFLDSTRNRSRRWCDPADCGNRSRQRRHYQRHRTAG